MVYVSILCAFITPTERFFWGGFARIFFVSNRFAFYYSEVLFVPCSPENNRSAFFLYICVSLISGPLFHLASVLRRQTLQRDDHARRRREACRPTSPRASLIFFKATRFFPYNIRSSLFQLSSVHEITTLHPPPPPALGGGGEWFDLQNIIFFPWPGKQ